MLDLQATGHVAFGVNIAMVVLSALAVLLRLYAKTKTRLGFASEDWLIIVAFLLQCAFAVILLRGKSNIWWRPYISATYVSQAL